MGNIVSTPVNYTAKLKAFPYQMQAFLTVKDLKYAAIFHEQGLGKTKIAIDLLLYWLQKRDIDTVLIVTKKQLVNNWINELKTHTFIIPKILSSNRSDNFYVFNSKAKIVVTNFETVSSELERVEMFLRCRNVGVIIDESAKLKNPAAKLTKDFFSLSKLFKMRVIMTGTPVANRPYDIWSQIYFLDQGKSLGSDFKTFKAQTDLPKRNCSDTEGRIEYEKKLNEIFRRISTFAIRETKKSSGIILPEKEYKTIYATFEKQQLVMYSQLIETLRIEIKKNGDCFIDDDSAVLKRLLRLLQITSNPSLINESYSGISGKEIELKKIINKIVRKKEKCIVWSSFIGNIEKFYKEFQEFGVCKIHGEITIEERNHSVYIFKNDPECRILFATPQSAKEGLTLTVANNVIFYDRGFNLDDYLQAQDRIHRISQTRTCYIYNLIMQDSIDIWIDKLLAAKQYAAFLTQGDISLSDYHTHVDYSYSNMLKEILRVK